MNFISRQLFSRNIKMRPLFLANSYFSTNISDAISQSHLADSASFSNSGDENEKFKPRTSSHIFHKFELRIIGSGGRRTCKHRGSPCSLLTLGKEKWLFDVGEGSVRQSLLSNSLYKDLSRIFISNVHPGYTQGLSTLLMIVAVEIHDSSNIPPLLIYGPQGLYNLVMTLVNIFRINIKRDIIVNEFVNTPSNNSDTSTSSSSSSSSNSNNSYDDDDDNNNEIHFLSNNSNSNSNSSNSNIKSAGSATSNQVRSSKFGGGSVYHQYILADSDSVWRCHIDEQVSVSVATVSHRVPCLGYIVKESDVAGTLDFNQCKALGVTDALKLRQLKSGFDLLLSDGRKVSASDVVGPSTKGRKLVLCGAAAQSPVFYHEAKDCDVLVQECSYPDDALANANFRGYSTPKLIALSALRMNAKRVILSQIDGMFLPIDKQSIHHSHFMNGRQTTRFDFELYDQTTVTLPPEHVIVGRDFTFIDIPRGGYSQADNVFLYKRNRFTS